MKYILLAAIAALTCVQAHAGQRSMPINLIGEWCFLSHEKGVTQFQLPSWRLPDGPCTKILSIEPTMFYGEDHHCEPVEVRQAADVAPSGTTYVVTVAASCQWDGPVNPGKVSVFEFARYKGNLTVTNK